MVLGVIPNLTKDGVFKVVAFLVDRMEKMEFDFLLSKSLLEFNNIFNNPLPENIFKEELEIAEQADIIISIGGDGTVLTIAHLARNFDTPIAGVNLGKLGFLAEYEINSIDKFLNEIKNGEYRIGERVALEGECLNSGSEFYALNDIVIDKGIWPKMVEMTIKADDDYVSTFSADGLVIATPTGSTAYSLSAGGPIVSPKSDVFILAPVAPHSLTMRPLVLSGKQTLQITINEHPEKVRVSCDGQRVYNLDVPLTIKITRSKGSLKLVHTKSINYFEILRKKFFWGLDVRTISNGIKELDDE
ncbi:MAG: NAD(+)/NADH kinase [Rhodothermaceae bacterium]